MKLTAGVQEALIAILLYDASPGGAAVVAGLLPPAVYDAFFKEIVAAGIDYLEKYKQPAGEHAQDLFDTLRARNKDDANNYDRIYASLQNTRVLINREYILKEAGNFATAQRLKKGISRAADALMRDTPEAVLECEQLLSDSLRHTYELFDPGSFFHDTTRSLRFLDREERGSFPTGIPQFDLRDLGPARKKLFLFGGATGAGKSWFMINLAKYAILARLKVCYVTMEMGEDEINQRMVQNFFSVTKREEKSIPVQRFRKRKSTGEFIGFAPEPLEGRPFFADPKIKEFLIPKVKAFERRAPLVVKEFPTGQLSIQMLKGYLAALEGAHGYIPDLLIVDYADLFNISASNKRLELDKIYIDLRGIAVEKNIAVATATQIPADAAKSKLATKFDASEAKLKVNHADVYITYNQTQDEHDLGLARLFVAKGRGDEDQFSVLLSQCYKAGQFVFETCMMAKTYWEHVEKEFSDEGDDGDE